MKPSARFIGASHKQKKKKKEYASAVVLFKYTQSSVTELSQVKKNQTKNTNRSNEMQSGKLTQE